MVSTGHTMDNGALAETNESMWKRQAIIGNARIQRDTSSILMQSIHPTDQY